MGGGDYSKLPETLWLLFLVAILRGSLNLVSLLSDTGA